MLAVKLHCSSRLAIFCTQHFLVPSSLYLPAGHGATTMAVSFSESFQLADISLGPSQRTRFPQQLSSKNFADLISKSVHRRQIQASSTDLNPPSQSKTFINHQSRHARPGLSQPSIIPSTFVRRQFQDPLKTKRICACHGRTKYLLKCRLTAPQEKHRRKSSNRKSSSPPTTISAENQAKFVRGRTRPGNLPLPSATEM